MTESDQGLEMDTIILQALIKELERQAQEDRLSPYVDCDSPSQAVVDGNVDLVSLAAAIRQEILRSGKP